MSVMPEFRHLFSAHTDAFRKLAQLTHAKLELFDAHNSTHRSKKLPSLVTSTLGAYFSNGTAATRVEAVSSAVELVVVRRWARLTEGVLAPGFAALRATQARARQSMSTLRLTSAAFDGGDDARYRAAKRSSAGELPPEPQRPAKEREGWKPGAVVEALARGGELLAGTSHMRAARIMNHSSSAR